MLENSVFLDITSKEPEPVEEQVVPEPVKEPEKPKEFPAICPQCLEADTLKIDKSVYKYITVRKGFWYKKYTFIPHYCRKCDNKYVEGHTEMEKPKFCWSRLLFILFGFISIVCGCGMAYHLYLLIMSSGSGMPAFVGTLGFVLNAYVGEAFNDGWQDYTRVKNITGYTNSDIESLVGLLAESEDWKKWFRKQEVFNYRKDIDDMKASAGDTRREHTVYFDGVPFSYHKKQEPTETPDIPTITSLTT